MRWTDLGSSMDPRLSVHTVVVTIRTYGDRLSMSIHAIVDFRDTFLFWSPLSGHRGLLCCNYTYVNFLMGTQLRWQSISFTPRMSAVRSRQYSQSRAYSRCRLRIRRNDDYRSVSLPELCGGTTQGHPWTLGRSTLSSILESVITSMQE